MFDLPKGYEIDHTLSFRRNYLRVRVLDKKTKEIILQKDYNLTSDVPAQEFLDQLKYVERDFGARIKKHFKSKKETIISKNYNI